MLGSIARFLIGGTARRFLWRRFPVLLVGYEAYKWYKRRQMAKQGYLPAR